MTSVVSYLHRCTLWGDSQYRGNCDGRLIKDLVLRYQISEPLLIIHGEADNNAGTHPIQSERLYQARKGNGGTARLVLLPYESHGYTARESVLHTLAEMIEWADKYVKNRAVK